MPLAKISTCAHELAQLELNSVLIAIFILLLIAFGTPQIALAEDTLITAPGRSVPWSPPLGTAVVISNGTILRAIDQGKNVQIVGKKPGIAVVRAGSSQVTVTVLSENAYRTYSELKNAVTTRRGLSVTVKNGVVKIEGRLLRFDDWEQLAAQVTVPTTGPKSETRGGYEFEAEVDDEIAGPAKARFSQLLTQAGLPDLALQVSPRATVSISADSKDLEERVVRVLGPYGFHVEKSSSTLGLEPLVRVQIILAEVRKKAMSRIGIEWPEAVGGQLLPSLAAPVGGQLLVGLNALEENGLGKVLASPTLLCRSGKSAEFLAGGEFPIRVSNRKTQEVVWKKHGVLLRISPQADFSGRMSIAITSEVSMIDGSQNVDGVPGLVTNRIETHFDLNRSRTIALSGLIKKEWSEGSKGLPALSTIPVIGALFGSQDYRENRTELVVFVTPEVLRPDQEEK